MDSTYLEKTPPGTRRNFYIIYGISAVLGLTMYSLVLVWNSTYRDGFAWNSDPMKQMNWHPVLLVLGLTCFYSQSILIFRVGRSFPKKILKLCHMSFNLTAFILSVIGLQSAFAARNTWNGTHMYSLHSWIGLLTVILFTIQFVAGFITYLFPGLPMDIRAMFMPIHTNCGIGIFVLGVAAVLTGLMTKALSAIQDYSTLSSEAYMVNFIALFVIVFAILVLYLVNNRDYKRVPLQSD